MTTKKSWDSTEWFWAKVKKGPKDECWEWCEYKDRNGYGRVHIPGMGHVLAHRIAYKIAVGEIPDGMELDHKCNNPSCVNPYHLRVCTSRQNKWNRKHGKISSSGMRGVTKHGLGWRAKIGINGCAVYLGTFPTKEEAYLAYCEAVKANFGEFANLEMVG